MSLMFICSVSVFVASFFVFPNYCVLCVDCRFVTVGCCVLCTVLHVCDVLFVVCPLSIVVCRLCAVR